LKRYKDLKLVKILANNNIRGGLYREVAVQQGFEKTLAGIIGGGEFYERLVPIQPGTVSDNIKSIADKLKIENYTGISCV